MIHGSAFDASPQPEPERVSHAGTKHTSCHYLVKMGDDSEEAKEHEEDQRQDTLLLQFRAHVYSSDPEEEGYRWDKTDEIFSSQDVYIAESSSGIFSTLSSEAVLSGTSERNYVNTRSDCIHFDDEAKQVSMLSSSQGKRSMDKIQNPIPKVLFTTYKSNLEEHTQENEIRDAVEDLGLAHTRTADKKSAIDGMHCLETRFVKLTQACLNGDEESRSRCEVRSIDITGESTRKNSI